MPTFHRRNGSVKYVPPPKLLEGLKLSVALPALAFATLLVGLVMLALTKAPVEQKWVMLRDYPAWRPFQLAEGGVVPADSRFAFERPVDAARSPRAVRFDSPMGGEHGALTYNAQPFMEANTRFGSNHLGDDLNGIGGMDTDLGDPVYAASMGRVIFAGQASPGWGKMVIVEFATGEGAERRVEQAVYAHLRKISVGVDMLVQRGEIIGDVGGADGRYPAHLHFEMRASDVADPGGGYFRTPLNRIDPEGEVVARRGAEDELLNAAPLLREGGEVEAAVEFDLAGAGADER
jgi:murein DD-endopeptidase MepM/ murein hydrolase activator NlpD